MLELLLEVQGVVCAYRLVRCSAKRALNLGLTTLILTATSRAQVMGKIHNEASAVSLSNELVMRKEWQTGVAQISWLLKLEEGS